MCGNRDSIKIKMKVNKVYVLLMLIYPLVTGLSDYFLSDFLWSSSGHLLGSSPGVICMVFGGIIMFPFVLFVCLYYNSL